MRTYPFIHREDKNVPDGSIVIMADDAHAFIHRITRLVVTMDWVRREQHGDGGGVTAGQLRFVQPHSGTLDFYHISGERIGSISWNGSGIQHFVCVTIELGDEFREGHFIVDSNNPIADYTKAVQVALPYPLEDVISELHDFIDDYGMEIV